ncbi:hypothetical protein [Butyrivibrio sp. AE3004]|uniref:hypothetical protein n=1 Tax=Butyrivibrio sp. AE3004 TaxID=1506994 RepID=UPI000493C1A1|nr:hypothetical protein [Butyrivibrio sp. AE3004]
MSYKDIKKIIEKIQKERSKTSTAMWEEAYAVSEIIDSEYYKDNIHSVRKLSSILGISKSTLSGYSTAVAFDKIHHFDKKSFTVTQVMKLSSLGNNYKSFVRYAKKNNIDYSNAKQTDLVKIINNFKEHFKFSNTNKEQNLASTAISRIYSELVEIKDAELLQKRINELSEKETRDLLFYLIKNLPQI